MADNCSVLDPFLYCKEPWMTEAFARDNAALTRALHLSITSSSSSSGAAAAAPITSPDTSSSPLLARRKANPLAAPTGRVSKRKSRASKRTPTTYITADPENFREMVQRVTGVRPDGEPCPVEPLLRPQPSRPVGVSRPVEPPACLPTLDTSAFLLNQAVVAPVRTGNGSFEPAPVEETGFEFDTLLSFPTLESWGVL